MTFTRAKRGHTTDRHYFCDTPNLFFIFLWHGYIYWAEGNTHLMEKDYHGRDGSSVDKLGKRSRMMIIFEASSVRMVMVSIYSGLYVDG